MLYVISKIKFIYISFQEKYINEDMNKLDDKDIDEDLNKEVAFEIENMKLDDRQEAKDDSDDERQKKNQFLSVWEHASR